MKRSILFSLCMIFVMGFSTYSPKSTLPNEDNTFSSPNPTLELNRDNVTITFNPGTAQESDTDEEAVEEDIVDGLYDDDDEVYNMWARRRDDYGASGLQIGSTIEINLPERMYIKELKYKFLFR